jgi:hypothetical protein
VYPASGHATGPTLSNQSIQFVSWELLERLGHVRDIGLSVLSSLSSRCVPCYRVVNLLSDPYGLGDALECVTPRVVWTEFRISDTQSLARQSR